MKIYIELNIEEGASSVVDTLRDLADAIERNDIADAEPLERRTMDDYRNISPDVLIDIDVR